MGHDTYTVSHWNETTHGHEPSIFTVEQEFIFDSLGFVVLPRVLNSDQLSACRDSSEGLIDLCSESGAIGRYVGPGQIQNSGGNGSFTLPLDLTQMPTPTGLVAAQAGETWNFTTWYRDAVGGSATSNFTDGVEVTFQ